MEKNKIWKYSVENTEYLKEQTVYTESMEERIEIRLRKEIGTEENLLEKEWKVRIWKEK